MPGVEVVLRYEQILHTLQTALDDGEKKYTAELNATIGRGSKSAGDLIKIIFADFMPALLQVSISVALAAMVEPLVGGIMLASGLTSFLVTRTQLRSQDGVRVGIARKKSHLDGSMTELLRGKPIVRTLNAVELEASRVRREATDLSKIERRHHRTMCLFDAGKMTIESIFGVGVVLLGVYLVIRGSSAGTVLTLYLLYTQFAAPLREIHRMRDEANEATIHVRQAFEILDDPIDPYFVRKAISQNATNVQIELRDVRVEYSGGIVAAEGVTFKVLQGQFFGLCGPAGSGKQVL
jgi:ABC-type multidrug transport system fused ATPase/permease subunit